MKHESQHRSQSAAHSQSQQNTAREFTSAEELLRRDAEQTTVPPGVASRLSQSIAKLPAPRQSWWQRWLKR